MLYYACDVNINLKKVVYTVKEELNTNAKQGKDKRDCPVEQPLFLVNKALKGQGLLLLLKKLLLDHFLIFNYPSFI